MTLESLTTQLLTPKGPACPQFLDEKDLQGLELREVSDLFRRAYKYQAEATLASCDGTAPAPYHRAFLQAYYPSFYRV